MIDLAGPNCNSAHVFLVNLTWTKRSRKQYSWTGFTGSSLRHAHGVHCRFLLILLVAPGLLANSAERQKPYTSSSYYLCLRSSHFSLHEFYTHAQLTDVLTPQHSRSRCRRLLAVLWVTGGIQIMGARCRNRPNRCEKASPGQTCCV